MFRQVTEAYQVLSDSMKRQAYDKQRLAAQQQNTAEWDRLDRKERELREREQRIRDTNMKSQAVFDEAERLTNKRTHNFDGETETKLNRMVGIKYCLWALIAVLIFLIANKTPTDIDTKKTAKANVVAGKNGISIFVNHGAIINIALIAV